MISGSERDYSEQVETPAFVIDLQTVAATADQYRRIRQETGARILYATKPLLHPETMALLADRLDGFTASSLFSARLCRQTLGDRGILNIVSPGYRDSEMDEIAALCNQVVLNSLSQWERFRDRLTANEVGLRVNPGLSYVPDARYDPGREGGKLGIPLAVLSQMPLSALASVSGLHLHTNCESPNFTPLWETVTFVSQRLERLLNHVSWINLGGGYRLTHPDEWGPLYQAIAFLQERYPQATVYLEPGASLVREAGTLIATVIDLFPTAQGTVAVLDTSINHLPEVFEYQYAPEVIGHDPRHRFGVTLAGATCLAGDTFGQYRFAHPLTLGSRIVFPNVGAYSFVRSHWFNGVGLPTLYTIDTGGRLHTGKRYQFADYANHLGWNIE